MRIRRALISVSDKTGLEELAEGLRELGVSMVASGGTARTLARAGFEVSTVGEVTGAQEMLDGRVKTLHPKIHAGILADRRNPQHLSQLKEHGISPIDLVVVNLYPFVQTVAQPDVKPADAIEQIDIGGPAMVRAAAKNHGSVAVVVSPTRYPEILEEMKSRSGALSDDTRAELAAEAFAHTAAYDMEVARWMQRDQEAPTQVFMALQKSQTLRYGENPHQEGGFYVTGDRKWRQIAGKDLSFTNVMDFDAAWSLASEFSDPTVVIVKHTNPCGVATRASVSDAYRAAYECDPRSAFGGIVGANREIDGPSAKLITELVAKTDVVVAPAFSKEALSIFREKKNLILIEALPFGDDPDVRSAAGGFLIQDADVAPDQRDSMKVVTSKQPSEEDWNDLLFAWKITKHVKSNSVVLANNAQALGVGAGQMSRVEAVELAARRAGDKAQGTVCATDGFFPFRDGVDACAAAGIRAVIHPGGSVRDPEVIAAADEHGLVMVITGVRHFRH
jgi:phosphoribosylaminoimidazolecarboxamide formyltransferase/IMP cyclohydrolase